MSIGQTTRSLTRIAKTRYPGASEADIRQLVLLQVGIALDNPQRTTKDEDILKLADAALDEAATSGEPWAVALKNSVRDNTVKPLVEKARAAGVDPVPVVVVETGLPEAEVRSMIEALDADAADKPVEVSAAEDDEGDDDEPASFPPSVTAQY